MKKKYLYLSVLSLTLFALWTITLCCVDMQDIGPQGSAVGLATLNTCVHRMTGVNMWLYTLTDWLSVIPLTICGSFGFLGLVQLIQRKNIFEVDKDILVLGIFYIVVLSFFAMFEILVINYRPVLINGVLEASYPSSTTMLVICVMCTAIIQFKRRIKSSVIKKYIVYICNAFLIFMVFGRLISGVHWFMEIIGGILLSCGLVLLYKYLIE